MFIEILKIIIIKKRDGKKMTRKVWKMVRTLEFEVIIRRKRKD